MTLTNCYIDLDQLRRELNIRDVTHDLRLDIAANAASRQADRYTGQRFWQDATVKTREFYADDYRNVQIPEGISTTTGLVVKTDDDDDGSFGTTLTITTHFIVLPTNAADETPVEPFRSIRVVDTSGGSFPMSTSGRPGVQVTAKFGWPAIPDEVVKATLIQAVQLFKASDAVFGGVQMGVDGGVLRVRGAMNPMAAALLDPFVRVE